MTTTLESAIRAGDVTAVGDLLSSGADPHGRGSDGRTPLIIASGLGRPRIVELLLRAGADVHTAEPRMGATALHKAAQSGAGDVIALLLDHGAFVDQQSPRLGHTPLMDAVPHEHEAAVRLLLARGADDDSEPHAGDAVAVAAPQGLLWVAGSAMAAARGQGFTGAAAESRSAGSSATTPAYS